MAANGFRVWSLPEPDSGGFSDTDKLLLCVGLAFYDGTPVAEPPPPDPPPSTVAAGGIGGGMGYNAAIHKRKPSDMDIRQSAFIRRDDEEVMTIVKLMFSVLLEQ